MDLPVPVPRDALRIATIEAAAAAERTLNASDVAGRALAVVNSARAAVAAYAGRDALATAFSAGPFRPSEAGHAELPSDLAKVGLEWIAANDLLAEAEAAHALLVVQAAAATAEARHAEARKVAAIADVMRETAAGMLPQLREAETLAGQLRASMAGYLHCWAFNHTEAFKPAPVEVSLLIKEPQAAPLMALAALSWQQAAARWEKYRTELANDPDAAPPGAISLSDSS